LAATTTHRNAVGAVLLQWQPGESDPRPEACMSRKLAGAQYQYDARNVEGLAVRMALTTWRTNLLGVTFETYWDHDSLKFKFNQKALSHHIWRLCEFLAAYNFTEIKYVPGPESVVPDFLSNDNEHADSYRSRNDRILIHHIFVYWLDDLIIIGLKNKAHEKNLLTVSVQIHHYGQPYYTGLHS